MIRHIVLFKLKDNSEEACKKLEGVFLSMIGKTPQIIDIAVGTDFLHSARSYDVMLNVTVADKAELEAYQKDEYHCNTVKTYVRSVVESSISIDMEE